MDGVSLVICTFNGSQFLPKTIDHIIKQRVPTKIPWEVLFINNASSDNTDEVIKQCWKSEIPMKIIPEEQKGLIYARLRGIKEARYDLISFIDDDNWICRNWVNEVYEVFHANQDIGVCGSKNEAVYEITPPNWIKKIEHSFAVGEQAKISGDVTNKKGSFGEQAYH
ncbi:MAG: glycosyltransferase [Bacteroidales bacterium]|nr:glycosyltransferase [Bacteroidales bacterium]